MNKDLELLRTAITCIAHAYGCLKNMKSKPEVVTNAMYLMDLAFNSLKYCHDEVEFRAQSNNIVPFQRGKKK